PRCAPFPPLSTLELSRFASLPVPRSPARSSLGCGRGRQAMQLDDSDGALGSWARFCALSGELVGGAGDLSVGPRLAPVVADLCARGLATLV
uniref:Uncharacterized protein n=1 Tax=Aegilops tauschii subsp. strangulata TaxID=200361 RepID=A0A453C8F6_AEGTS